MPIQKHIDTSDVGQCEINRVMIAFDISSGALSDLPMEMQLAGEVRAINVRAIPKVARGIDDLPGWFSAIK